MNAAVIRFPRAMKRGAKVRRGPCARMLSFPMPLSGEELENRFSWICSNEGEWKNEETEGTNPPSNDYQRELKKIVREALGTTEPTDAAKRQRIAEGRKRIEKRNRVKDWIESQGGDLDTITTPEQALFFVFDRLA
jgi:hypothetical protein